MCIRDSPRELSRGATEVNDNAAVGFDVSLVGKKDVEMSIAVEVRDLHVGAVDRRERCAPLGRISSLAPPVDIRLPKPVLQSSAESEFLFS